MKIYCYKCNKDVEYKIKERVSKNIRVPGIDIEYVSDEAFCIHCGTALASNEMWDVELRIIREAYLKAKEANESADSPHAALWTT